MRAGSLNRRVTVQRKGSGHDAWGQPLQEWTDVATVWANVRVMSGREVGAAGSVESIASASVRVRYRKDFSAGMRVLVGDIPYHVVAALPDEQRREFLDLACEITI